MTHFLVDTYQRFEEKYSFHLHGKSSNNKAVINSFHLSCSKSSEIFYQTTRRNMQHVPLLSFSLITTVMISIHWLVRSRCFLHYLVVAMCSFLFSFSWQWRSTLKVERISFHDSQIEYGFSFRKDRRRNSHWIPYTKSNPFIDSPFFLQHISVF